MAVKDAFFGARFHMQKVVVKPSTANLPIGFCDEFCSCFMLYAGIWVILRILQVFPVVGRQPLELLPRRPFLQDLT